MTLPPHDDEFSESELQQLAEMARQDDLRLPPPEGLETPLSFTTPEMTLLPGRLGKKISEVPDESLSIGFRRRAVLAGMPKSETYKDWRSIEREALRMLRDPAWVAKAEEALRSFSREFGVETACKVAVNLAFWRAIVSALGV